MGAPEGDEALDVGPGSGGGVPALGKAGGRPARNAASPSARSGSASATRCDVVSSSRASPSPREGSSARRRFTRRSALAGPAAIRCASASARASTVARGTTSTASPQRSASAAVTTRSGRRRSSARARGAEEARQMVRRARFGDEADRGVAGRERGVVGEDAQIACEREVEPGARGAARHGGDRRLQALREAQHGLLQHRQDVGDEALEGDPPHGPRRRRAGRTPDRSRGPWRRGRRRARSGRARRPPPPPRGRGRGRHPARCPRRGDRS